MVIESISVHCFLITIIMNLIDRQLQKQHPNNALLMIVSSLGIVQQFCVCNVCRCSLLFRYCLFIWIKCFSLVLFLFS